MSATKECYSFSKNGNCKFGDKCHFAHTTAGTAEPVDHSDKVCDYYLSERGCVKGEECDHFHPVAPSGAKTNKVCDFYGSPKGCTRGNECEFLHLTRTSPSGTVTDKICTYFLQPQGCRKGRECEFLHPRAVPARLPTHTFEALKATRGRPGFRGGRGVSTRSGIRGKVCDYYGTEVGCKKGNQCEYIHRSDKPCKFFNSAEGCKKGEICNFTHTAQ